MSPHDSNLGRSILRLNAIGISALAAITAAGTVGGVSSAAEGSSTQRHVSAAIATSPSTTYAVIRTIAVGNQPLGITIDQDDDTVYVSNYLSNSVSVIDQSSGSLVDTFAVGNGPQGIAVNDADDSIYVALQDDNRVLAVNGRSLDDSFSIAVNRLPLGIAVNQADDTVYVTNQGSFFYGWGTTVSVIDGRTGLLDDTLIVGTQPVGIAVDQSDDTIYVANYQDNDLSVIAGNNTDDSFSTPLGSGASPRGIAVNDLDDTVYVTGNGGGGVFRTWVINGRSSDDSTTIVVGNSPNGVAVNQSDDTVYVGNQVTLGTISVLDGQTATLTDDTLSVGDQPYALAVDDDSGIVYVTNVYGVSGSQGSVSVIAPVTPTLGAYTGSSGDAVGMTLAVPVAYDIDDTTVQSVSFGGNAATGLTRGAGNTWTMNVPSGVGAVDVTVALGGGLTASAGTFTYNSAPPPPPTYPPTPPLGVTAAADDGSAMVTWQPPASSGSFPITQYQVIASPGGQTCLVNAPTLACEITGLANAVTYTFTVKALNGAGWGAYSEPSNAVTPEQPKIPTITISGTRGDVRGKPGVIVTGSTTNIAAGTILLPRIHFQGEIDYYDGLKRIPVRDDGSFTWNRRTGKKIYVIIRVADQAIRSNRLILPKQ